MSKIIGDVGDVVELKMTLEEVTWIGNKRPVLANMFKTSDGDMVSIISTKQIIKAIALGEQVVIRGKVKAHRVIDKQFVTQLEKPVVTAANLNGRGGGVYL